MAGGLNAGAGLDAAGGIGGLLAVEQAQTDGGAGAGGVDAGDYVYFYDANGNVGQVVAWASGFGGTTGFDWDTTPATLARVVARYEYDPYGNVIGPDTDQDGEFEPAGDDDPGVYADENAWRFSTKPFDPATGLGLWGERWYHPSLGRWMSRDPIGELGGENLYAYVENNPSDNVDPQGLNGIWDDPDPNPDNPPKTNADKCNLNFNNCIEMVNKRADERYEKIYKGAYWDCYDLCFMGRIADPRAAEEDCDSICKRKARQIAGRYRDNILILLKIEAIKMCYNAFDLCMDQWPRFQPKPGATPPRPIFCEAE